MATEEKKMTQRDYFELIKAKLADEEDIVAFCDERIAALDHRAEKAKEYKAKKQAESDALKQAIAEALTEEFQTADEILTKVQNDDKEVTKAKITARVSALVREGQAVKAKVKIDKRTLTAYALPGAEVEADAE